MFGAATGAFGGGGGGNALSLNLEGYTGKTTGLSGAAQQIKYSNDRQAGILESYTNPAAAVAGGPVGLEGGGATSAPVIPMSDSYNAAASSPVFSPASQGQAAAVFGSNDERQGSTSGFKQEVKDRIIGDLHSL
tara:strand:- start:51 stop:452 length:402 start_codon:yes stop_codon:yes gene_type:complete